MKTKIGLVFLVAVFVLTSACRRSDMQVGEANDNFIIRISTEEVEAKVNVDQCSVKWMSGDEISVYEVVDNKFGEEHLFRIMSPEAISADGKSADFVGPKLESGKKYVAVSSYNQKVVDGFLTIGNSLGQIESNIDHIGASISLLSVPETVSAQATPNFRFKHQMAVVELNLTLDKAFKESYPIRSIEIETAESCFLAFATFNANGEIVKRQAENCVRLFMDDNLLVEPNVLSPERSVKGKFLVWWNDQVTSPVGEAKITINTTNANIKAIVKKPIQVFEPGKLYASQLDINPRNYYNSDRDVLMAIYNATGGANWVNKTNWGSDKPLEEWFGVYCYDGRVQGLNFFLNNLLGSLPPEIGLLDDLQSLNLHGNSLSGKIPSEFANLTDLSILWLSGNKLVDFEQTVNILAELKKLHTVHVDANYFYQGKFPEKVAAVLSLPNLDYFDMRCCGLDGKIPSAVLNHPRWNRFAFTMIPQRIAIDNLPAVGGLDLAGVNYYVSEFSIPTVNGEMITKASLKNKTLTILSPVLIGIEDQGVDKLTALYQRYQADGLGIISQFREFRMGLNKDWVNNQIKTNTMTWWNFVEASGENPISNLPREYSEGYGINIWPPISYVLDPEGRVVFNSAVDGEDKLGEFLSNYYGKSNLYESQDYSKDGQITQLQTATQGAGVNIVLMGDGFADRDMNSGGRYETIMRQAMNHLFDIEPIKSYKDCFNVYTVKAVSKNEGFNFGAKTIFECSFAGGTQINGNTAQCAIYAKKIPGVQIEKTLVVVVLNSPKYAGTTHLSANGEAYAFTPYISNSESEFAKVVHHEAIGHGLGKLMDEYIYNDEPITSQYVSELQTSQSLGWGMNLSLSPTQVPWKHFFSAPNYSMVGTYEGGYFFSRGVWRAEQNSCMNDNIPYFNGPSRELIVKQIKQLSGEPYNWSEFVTKDKYEPVMAPASRAVGISKPSERFAPPVLIRKK